MSMTSDQALLFGFVSIFLFGAGLTWYAMTHWAAPTRRRRRHA